MRRVLSALMAGLAVFTALGAAPRAVAQQAQAAGPYRVQQTVKVGGDGGFDYVYADTVGRRLYVPRSGATPRVSVYDLDTLAPIGEIPTTAGHGAATDAEFHHGFVSCNPIVLWDTRTLAVIKTIPVQGDPDGILGDAYNHRIYVFSHSAPNVTVLSAADGSVIGTMDLGGAPEQAATDGRGHLYVDLEDQASVAVVDARTLTVTARYSLNGKAAGDSGLALDARSHVLFVACRDPQTMVMLDADDGHYLADLPIGQGCDGAAFNPQTGECFSSQRDGTLTVIKETDPTDFAVEQTVTTIPSAKTLTLDRTTGKLYLIAAQFGPVPASAPGPVLGNPRPRRGPMVPGSFSILVVGK